VEDPRTRFGYTAPIGTTDDPRMRRLTVHLPPAYAVRLFTAQQQGADEQWLRAIFAEGLQEIYFKDNGSRTADLACERLGSADVTSIEVDPHRLEQAASALYTSGCTPTLAVADGLYGYWPEASFDRTVAACSFRAVPPALLAQTRPGGKILLTLSGWLYGYARVCSPSPWTAPPKARCWAARCRSCPPAPTQHRR
jgi:hypothetical protein